MIAIEPLGTEIFLPAIVVGYEIPEAVPGDQIAKWTDSPEWMVTIWQQAGGMAMRYPTLAGAVLRLADNVDKFHGNAGFLIRGFRAMAEDPDLPVLRSEYPLLRKMVETEGEEYRQGLLGELEQMLARYLTVPAPESGIEAFVRLAQCDLLQYFSGWKMLGAKVLASYQAMYRREDCPVAQQGNLDGFEFAARASFGTEALGPLAQLGMLVGQDRPRAFLLWENCD